MEKIYEESCHSNLYSAAENVLPNENTNIK